MSHSSLRAEGEAIPTERSEQIALIIEVTKISGSIASFSLETFFLTYSQS
jgi:hypothetical protein